MRVWKYMHGHAMRYSLTSLLSVFVILAAGTVIVQTYLSSPMQKTLPPELKAAGDNVSQASTLSEFNRRKEVWGDAVLVYYGANRDDQGITGLILMERAMRTGDMSRVKEANDRLVAAVRYIDDPDYKGDKRPAYEGYALIFANAVLKFGGRTDIMYPATLAKLKEGTEPSGSGYPSNVNESLRFFHRMIAFSDDRKIGVGKYNPWTNLGAGTENHKVQEIASGMMIAKIYAGQTYTATDGTFPFYDSTPAGDDYYHYWQKAFSRWLFNYGELDTDVALTKHIDGGIGEKDSPHYGQVFFGDLWLIREYAEDATTKKYAEMYLDLLLADTAEEMVGGLYTGAHSRSYDEFGMSKGPRTGFLSPVSYLLFDALPYGITELGWPVCSWGCWGLGAVITSSYNPTHADFPLVVADVYKNKPATGYSIFESEGMWPSGPANMKAGWVTSRYGLGFQLKYGCGAAHSCGGLYVNDDKGAAGGGVIVPFVGDDPDYRYKPDAEARGVVGPGAAIVRVTESDPNLDQTALPSKLWIRNGWLEKGSSGSWTFYRARSVDGKEVYAAVRPALGGATAGSAVNGGEVKVMTTKDDFWVFDVSDGDKFTSFGAYKSAVLAGVYSTVWPWIDYTSSSGTRVKYNRSTGTRWVNEVESKDEVYKYVIKNPWMEWKVDAREANFSKNGRTAFYDFDANNDGVFTDPVKRVANGGQVVATPVPTTGTVVPTAVPSVGPTSTPATGIISTLLVRDTVNAADWSVQTNLKIGDMQFGDRDYAIIGVPGVVAGAEWVRSAADSKAYTTDPVATFNVTKAARVYVVHDNRVGTKPSWMSEWVDSGQDLLSDAPGATGFSLYHRDYSSGAAVSLGNNGNTTQLMYTIAVTAVPTTTATPTPTPALINKLTNGGFETGSGSSAITGYFFWPKPADVPGVSYAWATDQVRSGLHSAKLVYTGTNTAQWTRWLTSTASLTAVPGSKYQASGYIKTLNVTGKASLVINFWDANLTWINRGFGESAKISGTSTGWVSRTVSGTAPTNAKYVRVEMKLVGPGTVWWDDLLLTR